MSTQKAKQVWEAVLGDLQLQVTQPSYETWLKGTVGLSYMDGEFVVGTPSAFVAEMLDQRMYSLISQALARADHDGVEVRFQVISPDHEVEAKVNGNHRSQSATKDALSMTRLLGANVADRPHNNSHDPVFSQNSSTNGQPWAKTASNLNPKYTFESFIVGRSNELAHAAADAVSRNPGTVYNPLFIYSGVGLGKTHLLHATGHRILRQGLSLIYATTEEFTNDYIRAIREGKTESFRHRYRTADVLLLDDIQFIIGKEQTQEGFFHTFNTLHMAGRQVVITSDRPVTQLTLLEDRVRSRLAGGLVVDIQRPDSEMRMDILRVKAQDTGCEFPQPALEFLADSVHKNIRELEGSLTRIAAYAHLTSQPITLELVKRAIADILHRPRTPRISDQVILDTVSSYFSIDKEAVLGRRRDKTTALARQVAMYLLREEGNMTLKAVGLTLGGKDHTTVLHACLRITRLLDEDPNMQRDIINIREKLAAA